MLWDWWQHDACQMCVPAYITCYSVSLSGKNSMLQCCKRRKKTQAFKKTKHKKLPFRESRAQVIFSLKFNIFLYANQACKFILDPRNSFLGLNWRLGPQHGYYFNAVPQGKHKSQGIVCNKCINKITIKFHWMGSLPVYPRTKRQSLRVGIVKSFLISSFRDFQLLATVNHSLNNHNHQGLDKTIFLYQWQSFL